MFLFFALDLPRDDWFEHDAGGLLLTVNKIAGIELDEIPAWIGLDDGSVCGPHGHIRSRSVGLGWVNAVTLWHLRHQSIVRSPESSCRVIELLLSFHHRGHCRLDLLIRNARLLLRLIRVCYSSGPR